MGDQYANCTVHHKMHSDRRFELLGELGGWTRNDASFRMVQLWARCTALRTDRPPAVEIRIHLGLRGEELLLAAALGERCADGSIRVLGGGLTGGDTDRFSWYEPAREQQREAGSKRAKTAVRGPSGRFGPTGDGPARPPATTTGLASAGPATASGSPADSSGPPASGFRIPDPEDQNSLTARTIRGDGGQPGSGQPGPRAMQPGGAAPGQGASTAAGNVADPQLDAMAGRVEPPPPPEPSVPAASPPAPAREDITRTRPAAPLLPGPLLTTLAEIAGPAFDPDDPRARARLAEATYRSVSDALVRIAAELRLPAPLPFPAITPASSGRIRELLDRVREEGADAPLVCDRVVANLIAQAREERSVEWLAEKAFTEGAWRTARTWMPGAAARRRGPARGDPLPPAPPPKRPERPAPDPVLSPEDRAEMLALAARVGANPEAAAAALTGGPSGLPTAELVKRFGDGQRAPPDDPIADEPRKQPKSRKAAT